MDTSVEEPLDERKWRAPEVAMEMNGIHNNSVLFYFARSDFFDLTSNNHATYIQAVNNPRLLYTIQTRANFEEALRKISGLEYVVLHDPSENDTKHPHSGIWVIRKQYRTKREGRSDTLEPLATYYIMGDTIYQSAPLGAILNAKLLTALTSLQKFLLTAKSLPEFTPATGHTYFPPTAKSAAAPASSLQAGQNKEDTPVHHGPSTSKTSTQQSYADARLYIEAWEQMHMYPEEYMDEYPLTGEPGNFRLTKEPKKAPKEKFDLASTTSTFQPFKESKKPPAPAPIKTDLPVESGKERKGTAKTPVTPGSGLRDKSGKKRKKSMAVGTAGSTPKNADSNG